MKEALSHLLGSTPPGDPTPVSGGCIHACYRWGPYFIKTNSADHVDNFRAEATGLAAIRDTGAIRVPDVIALDLEADRAFIVLEHLDLISSGDEALLGERLAALHQHLAENHGFPEDNFIGATTQPNPRSDRWPDFFAEHRLGHLFDLLTRRGVSFPGSERLLSRIPELLPDDPPPSLLHGDLWAGNKAFLPDGTPVLFDPACYHGHAAADIAMTKLFGGFGGRFYDAYRSHSDLDDPSLHELYNLYHVLNHAALFGGGYVSQAGDIIRRFS
jgi:fructosamine-3-kinase